MAQYIEKHLQPIDNGRIYSKLEIPDTGSQITVDETISKADLINALNVYSGINFKISWLVSNFKVYDASGLVTSFSAPLRITIYYEGLAWYLGLSEHNNRPRVAYLARDGDSWADAWVEFSKNDIKKATAPENGKPGKIVIEVDYLPDPLIGSC